MRLDSVHGNSQRLDGGSMFGNCPRAVWERWAPPDEAHRIPLACRCLLVRESTGKTILFEAGIGSFFPPKLRDRYGVQESEHRLLRELAELGVGAEQIDLVVLSHLHFDHAGGLLTAYEEGAAPRLAFPRARYLTSHAAWMRARTPHPRDRASFVPELVELLETSGRLECEDRPQSKLLGDGYRFSYSDGHTPGLMLTTISTPKGPLTFMGDLVPGRAWLHLPITMGYDRYPELVIDEKARELERLEREQGWAFFTHDPDIAACRVSRDERGRFAAAETLTEIRWNPR